MLDRYLEQSFRNHRFSGQSRIHMINVKLFCQNEIDSETWALPITALFAIVAYAVVAAVFYNKDG